MTDLAVDPAPDPPREPATARDAAQLAMLELAAKLSAALGVDDIARLVTDEAVRVLGARAGFVAVVNDDGSELRMHSHARADGDELRLCRLETSESLPVVDAWRSGLPVYVHGPDALYDRYPQMDRTRADRHALAALPLVVDGEVLGAINLTFDEEQPFDAQQSTVLLALAALCSQALRRAQLIDDVERMRRDFAITASHELHTPLTSIYGAALTMSGDFELPEETRRQLTRLIATEAERMRSVLEDLRITTDPDPAGAIQVRLAALDLTALLREAALTVAQAAPGEPPPVEVFVDPPGLHVVADASRLRQVLGHLADNARKYGPRGGRIRMTARAVAADRVRIEVLDEGPGMRLRERNRAFERFYRADPLNRSGVAGTGLGLYVARLLIEAMGGDVGLDAGPEGIGTLAWVELPTANAAPPTT